MTSTRKTKNTTNTIDTICTCCGEKKQTEFYVSNNIKNKATKKLSICKNCISDLFDYYLSQFEYQRKAMFWVCRRIDVPFSTSIYLGAESHSSKTGWKIWQSYFKELNSFGDTNNYGSCFEDGQQVFDDEMNDNSNGFTSDEEVDEELKIFWGYGFDPKDYLFLETELANWKSTHKCDNQSEITLLKEICIKILDLRKSREKNNNTSKDIKDLQELMKTASVDPAKANIADGGKSLDAYGLWIKDIEEYEPAEYFEDKKLFEDFDKIKDYTQKYIFRPIKNLLTGSRDFDIENASNDDSEGDE